MGCLLKQHFDKVLNGSTDLNSYQQLNVHVLTSNADIRIHNKTKQIMISISGWNIFRRKMKTVSSNTYTESVNIDQRQFLWRAYEKQRSLPPTKSASEFLRYKFKLTITKCLLYILHMDNCTVILCTEIYAKIWHKGLALQVFLQLHVCTGHEML